MKRYEQGVARLENRGGHPLPYRDGEPVRCAALWCSQQTQDFFPQADMGVWWSSCEGVILDLY